MSEPATPTLADRLDAMAEGMRLFPAMCCTADAIALVRAAAGRIRELELEVGSLVVALEYLGANARDGLTYRNTVRHANECLRNHPRQTGIP